MEKTKGIFLVAFGKRGYGFMAYNLAFSIKHYNPNLKIFLYHDKESVAHLFDWQKSVFDFMEEIPIEQFMRNEKIDPAKVKMSVYEKLPFDYNLFIDVDALALQDLTITIDQLIAKGGYYYSHIVGLHTIDQGRDFRAMQWAWADDIWEHYSLPEDAVLPATNSSFQFIKKCPESAALIKQMRENYQRPIPLEKLRLKWGGSQPDELYLNIALAQKGITGQTGREYIFFGASLDQRNFQEIKEQFSILSIYGGKNFTKIKYTEWYDRMLLAMHREKKLPHLYKYCIIANDKHANGK